MNFIKINCIRLKTNYVAVFPSLACNYKWHLGTLQLLKLVEGWEWVHFTDVTLAKKQEYNLGQHVGILAG